jgi:hypothetical protein
MVSMNDERDDKQNGKITHGGYSSAQQGTTHLLALVLNSVLGQKDREIYLSFLGLLMLLISLLRSL